MSQRGGDPILSVYSDARAEYTKQLCVFLAPAYFQFYTELLEKAKQTMATEPKKALWQFQTYLNEIHDWNTEKVSHEIRIIHQNSGCDYLEDLLTAVFIAHTKVLTAIRLNGSSKKVEIHIPKVDHFLFKVLCETAKLLWSSTYLFRDGIPAIEKQQNYRTIEGLLNEGILQAVRGLVPVKSILKDFVNSDAIISHEDSDDDEGEVENDRKNTPVTESLTEDTDRLQAVPKMEELLQSVSEATLSTPAATLSTPELIPDTSSITTFSQNATSSVPEVTSSVPEVTSSVPQVTSSVPQVTSSVPQTIVIQDKPGVRFAQFNTVFGIDDPTQSDMIYDGKENMAESHLPDLEILDGSGEALSEGLDFVNLDELSPSEPESISADDYEVLQ